MKAEHEIFVKGYCIKGSSVVYRKHNGFLQKGLCFADGIKKWFPGAGIGNFHDNLAVISMKKKYGYIDRNGEIVIPIKYMYGSDFSNGLASVIGENGSCIINIKGKELLELSGAVITFTYNESCAKISILDSEFANVTEFIIDENGADHDCTESCPIELFKESVYDNDLFSCGLVRAVKDGKFGFVNQKGEEIIPFKYDKVSRFHRDFAAVKLNGKAGFIDIKGEPYLSGDYEDAAYTREGYFFVKKNGCWGAVDYQDKELIEFKFDEIGTYQEGIIPFRIGGLWGIMDLIGSFSFEPISDIQPNYSEGVINYMINGKQGVVNRNGDALEADFIENLSKPELN
ncbi:MAG: WG repeat-containing protein [Melioribacteraceae bacterium]